MSVTSILRKTPDELVRKLVSCKRPDLSDDVSTWTHEDMLDAAGVALGIPHCSIDENNADLDAFLAAPSVYQRLGCVPLFRHDILVVVACAEPWAEDAIRGIRKALQSEVQLVGATEDSLATTLAHLLGRARQRSQDIAAAKPKIEFRPPVRRWHIDSARPQESMRKMVYEAFRLGASDIILDTMENRLRVRFRIHGVAEEFPPISQVPGTQLISTIKAYSNLSTDELSVPQSGGCRIGFDSGGYVDLRVECQPTAWGSSLVIRILDPASISRHIGTLPFTGRDLDVVKSVMEREQGITIITGPTGSGKTTTLYRMLTSIDLSENNVRTIEDPVEYRIDGIVQLPAPQDENHRPRFDLALRSHMRADPDVIMVGEVRDKDTADIAIQASLTGHKIFTTLHTTTAAGTVRRLMELGVTPFLLRESLSLVIAQRLVAKLCPKCKVANPTTKDIASHFIHHGLEVPANVYSPCGCPDCNGSGIIGRLPVFELMLFTGHLSSMLSDSMNDQDLINAWINEGGEPLAKRGLMLAAEGLTSHKEIRGLESNFIPAGGWETE